MIRRTYLLLIFILTTFTTYAQEEQSSPNVIGGEVVGEQEYPWMVALVYDGKSGGCGGSLIDPQWVLTAAHCLLDLPGFPECSHVLINSVVRDTSILESHSELIEVEEIFLHEEVSVIPFNIYPDIALIRLKEPATIPTIELAEYTDASLYEHQKPGKVLGWGITESEGEKADSLLLGNLFFIGNDECSDLYATTIHEEKFLKDPNGLICAGYFENMEPVGASFGDSGGPLFFEEDGMYKQVGIVFGGKSDITTLDFPGIFTLVPEYRDWIDGIMGQFENPTSTSPEIWEEELKFDYYNNQHIRISNLEINHKYDVELYDFSGKRLTSISLPITNESINFSVDDYLSGVYILVVRNHSKGTVTNMKFFKD